ncbi:MAG: hypothetical protein N2V75_03805 [Methanophagales archaeon]|nr:hypothetical protein [Methanophagales archaeon]
MLEWIKDKYGVKKAENKEDVDTDNFLKGKKLEELSHDEYVVLIDSYHDDSETLGLIAEAISLNENLSEDEKNELWDKIDREMTMGRED